MPDYEVGREAIAEVAAWANENATPDRNEASTRFHLIDRLLKEVLGWSPEEIEVEVREPEGVSDYQLGRPSASLVLEAKRESIGFELPAGFNSPELSLRSLAELDSRISAAIDQVMVYGH